MIQRKMSQYNDTWPIDQSAGASPVEWDGWPDGKRFALVLTHDVDTEMGQEKCHDLINLEQEMGFRSSFNFVPERYDVSAELRHYLTQSGFEVGVHGLCHDGKLYKTREIFEERSVRINRYLGEWESVGFRSPSMHHNLEWIHELAIEYDSSTFDTDPFEPQPDGMGTIFPFRVENHSPRKGYVELPYTLPQDFTLFVLLNQKDVTIWKQKLDWIAGNGGMALLNAHPDYMRFDGKKPGPEEYPARYYKDFLEYIKENYENEYWHALPRDVARFFNNVEAR
jgi:hypothetical protein